MGSKSIQAVCCTVKFDKLRPALQAQLLQSPGRDLVLVKNGPHNPTGYEMVHNDADIDNSQIVWAHRIDAEKDARLVAYFAGRRVWEFEWLDPKTTTNGGHDDGDGDTLPYRFTALVSAPAQ